MSDSDPDPDPLPSITFDLPDISLPPLDSSSLCSLFILWYLEDKDSEWKSYFRHLIRQQVKGLKQLNTLALVAAFTIESQPDDQTSWNILEEWGKQKTKWIEVDYERIFKQRDGEEAEIKKLE
jgi:hypothetical protein